MKPPLLAITLAALIPAAAWAQSHIYTFSGKASGDRFGFSAKPAGDVDGDGYPDLVIAAPRDDTVAVDAGRVVVVSGRDGTIIRSWFGNSAGDEFGWAASSAGDVDNDGVPDIVVGAPFDDQNALNAGSVWVYSGKTGKQLHAFHGKAAHDSFGISACGAGDVDKDGHDDIIIGAHADDTHGTNAGAAFVYSGKTGLRLHAWFGDSAQDFFGHSIASAGDIDNDGYPDLLVGSPDHDGGGIDSGMARLFSGKTGKTIRTLLGSTGDYFGHHVANAGDVDKDGVPDQIIGANQFFRAVPGTGYAQVFSGKTGKLLQTLSGASNGDFFGEPVEGGGDLDGDGWPDVIVGAHRANTNGTDSGQLTVYSGRTWQKLRTIDGKASGDYFGYSAAFAGDLDKDGVLDLVVGAYRAGTNGAGIAQALSGTILALTSDRHSISLSAQEAQTLALNAGKTHANEIYIVLGSSSGTMPGIQVTNNLTLPLNWDGYLRLLTGAPNSIVQSSVGVLDKDGRGTAKFTVATQNYPPSIVGLRLDHAFLVIDLTQLTIVGTSNAVPLTLAR